MLNLIDMINANLSQGNQFLPSYDSWSDLSESAQDLIANLALDVSSDTMKSLRIVAHAEFPDNGDEVVWQELKSYELERNINKGSAKISLLEPV